MSEGGNGNDMLHQSIPHDHKYLIKISFIIKTFFLIDAVPVTEAKVCVAGKIVKCLVLEMEKKGRTGKHWTRLLRLPRGIHSNLLIQSFSVKEKVFKYRHIELVQNVTFCC